MSDTKLINRDTVLKVINKLAEEDLLFLNMHIVERLKLISQAKSTCLMANFNIGNSVKFRSSDGRIITGVIIRLNKKTASIQTDEGTNWKVSPGFLMEV